MFSLAACPSLCLSRGPCIMSFASFLPFPWLLVLHPFLWNLYFLWIPYLFLPQFPFPLPFTNCWCGITRDLLACSDPPASMICFETNAKTMRSYTICPIHLWLELESFMHEYTFKNKQSLYVWNDAAALLTLRSIRLSAMPTEKIVYKKVCFVHSLITFSTQKLPTRNLSQQTYFVKDCYVCTTNATQKWCFCSFCSPNN